MGITNGAFPTERDESEACMFASAPNSDVTLDEGTLPNAAISSIDRFTIFMRLLAPPRPSNAVAGATPASIDSGNKLLRARSPGPPGARLPPSPSCRVAGQRAAPAGGDTAARNRPICSSASRASVNSGLKICQAWTTWLQVCSLTGEPAAWARFT